MDYANFASCADIFISVLYRVHAQFETSVIKS